MRLIDADELEPKTMKEEAEMMCTNALYIIKNAPIVPAIPLDKAKQAREEIENKIKFWSEPSKYNVKPVIAIQKAKAQSYKHCLEILDKLIEGGEE